MSKPLYWLVFVNSQTHKFTSRARMRLFVGTQKALGRSVIVKPVGF